MGLGREISRHKQRRHNGVFENSTSRSENESGTAGVPVEAEPVVVPAPPLIDTAEVPHEAVAIGRYSYTKPSGPPLIESKADLRVAFYVGERLHQYGIPRLYGI